MPRQYTVCIQSLAITLHAQTGTDQKVTIPTARNTQPQPHLLAGMGSMSPKGQVAAKTVEQKVAMQNATINKLPGLNVKKNPLVLAEKTVKKSDNEIFK